LIEQIGDEFELNTTLTSMSQAQGLTVTEMIDRLDNRKDARTIYLITPDRRAIEKRGTTI
jgi:hypothetical protein